MRALLVCALIFSYCYGQVNFITPCRESDYSCLMMSAQNAVTYIAAGVETYGMRPLDPLYLGVVTANQAGLKMEFQNTVVKGLRKCQIQDIQRRGDYVSMSTKCSVTMTGDYNLDGKLLVMPINGNGRYRIKIKNIVVDFSFMMGRENRGGVEYWTFENWSSKDHVESGVRFLFHNLFNGNAVLSAAIHNFANENWQTIYSELSAPIVNEVMREIVEEIRKLFYNVPIYELALD